MKSNLNKGKNNMRYEQKAELQDSKLDKKERLNAWQTLEAILKLIRLEVRDE